MNQFTIWTLKSQTILFSKKRTYGQGRVLEDHDALTWESQESSLSEDKEWLEKEIENLWKREEEVANDGENEEIKKRQTNS